MFDELTRASQKVVGLKQVERGAQSGEISRIYIAADSDQEIRLKLIDIAKQNGIDYVMVPSRKQLGEVCGIKVNAACAGLLK